MEKTCGEGRILPIITGTNDVTSYRCSLVKRKMKNDCWCKIGDARNVRKLKEIEENTGGRKERGERRRGGRVKKK